MANFIKYSFTLCASLKSNFRGWRRFRILIQPNRLPNAACRSLPCCWCFFVMCIFVWRRWVCFNDMKILPVAMASYQPSTTHAKNVRLGWLGWAWASGRSSMSLNVSVSCRPCRRRQHVHVCMYIGLHFANVPIWLTSSWPPFATSRKLREENGNTKARRPNADGNDIKNLLSSKGRGRGLGFQLKRRSRIFLVWDYKTFMILCMTHNSSRCGWTQNRFWMKLYIHLHTHKRCGMQGTHASVFGTKKDRLKMVMELFGKLKYDLCLPHRAVNIFVWVIPFSPLVGTRSGRATISVLRING